MTRSDLLPFCSKDPWRESIATPWNTQDHTYATDGRILIRITPPLPDCRSGMDYPIPPELPPDTIPTADTPDWLHLELPESWQETPATLIDCKSCEGTGKVRDCPNCEGTGETTCCSCGHTKECSECEGDGYLTGEGKPCEVCSATGKTAAEVLIPIGNQLHLRKPHLELITTLPGWQIRHHPANMTLRIDFSGGIGAVIAVRK